ncbi:MAG: T9SS type A sorting domain-containing protein [Dysgonamonadaceae bacterium]|jgi:hypothetical protein|nr:T9SS type A sorting domain-containing protein [Dysgonamonadaceae bacterium]
MKLNYFFKSLALVALVMVTTSVRAADVFHVADGATDTEFAAVLDQAQTGDVIIIDGFVTINAMVHITKNVTIKAAVDGDGEPIFAGFDGGEQTRLFEIHPEAIDGAKLVFLNLNFTGGNGALSDPTDGGVARIYDNCVVEFIYCYFYDNTAFRGGAFFITPGDVPAPIVTFKGCQAMGNIAKGSGNESRGGYLFVDGADVQINHEYCYISGNQTIGGRGGAFCLFGANTRYFYHCLISSNLAGNWGEDPNGIVDGDVKLDMNGNPVSDGEYEGAVAFITGGATTFESCGFVNNKSWSHSGLIRGWGDESTITTFINCTLTQNQSLHDRSPFWIGGSATYTFVNSLFVENLGQNQGNGAGFDFDGATAKLNIFNSVFARNVAGGDGAVDIRNAANYANQLTVKNSLIGLIQGDASGVVPVDNPNIPTKSNIAMYKVSTELAQLDYATLENGGAGSGIDYGKGVRYSTPFEMPYYLQIAGSDITKLGDPAVLGDYVNADMFDKEHIRAADGSIPAAPTLASTADKQYDQIPDYNPTGFTAPKSAVPGVKLLNNLVNNGLIGIDYGDLRGQAKAELYSVTGQKIENVFSRMVVGKGFYDLKTATPGMYLLKITVAGKTSTQRLIVK